MTGHPAPGAVEPAPAPVVERQPAPAVITCEGPAGVGVLPRAAGRVRCEIHAHCRGVRTPDLAVVRCLDPLPVAIERGVDLGVGDRTGGVRRADGIAGSERPRARAGRRRATAQVHTGLAGGERRSFRVVIVVVVVCGVGIAVGSLTFRCSIIGRIADRLLSGITGGAALSRRYGTHRIHCSPGGPGGVKRIRKRRLRRRVLVTAAHAKKRQQEQQFRADAGHDASMCSRRADACMDTLLSGETVAAGTSRANGRFVASRWLDTEPSSALTNPSDSAPMAQREDE